MDLERRLREALTPCAPGPALRAAVRARLAAQARITPTGSILRLVPRRTLIFVSGFAVLAAAAAVVSLRYVVPALQRASEATPPRESMVVASLPMATPPLASSPAIAPPTVPTASPPIQAAPVPQVDRSIQPLAHEVQEVNKPASTAVAITAVSAAAVSAERLQGSEIPTTQATWVFYSQVLSAQDGSSPAAQLLGQDLALRLQLDADRYRALLAHMQATTDGSNLYKQLLRQEMCSRRAELTTIERWDSELQKIDRDVDDHRAKLMQGAESILGIDGKARLDAAVENMRRGTVVRVSNYLQDMRMNQVDADAAARRYCRQFDSPGSQGATVKSMQ